MTKHTYIQVSESAVPGDVRFDVPRRHQGQMVEIAYGGHCRSEHDDGDMYRRVTDRATRQVRYAKLSR